MKQMKLVLKLATTFFAAFLIFATLSCEVGLGSAVDTERPDLAITYPPKGAIIRDTFTLAGTVSDDVGVTFINVVLTHKTLKTEYVYKSSEGQVNIVAPANGWSGGTTWTATLGKKTDGQKLFNGWDLPDGDYFIDVEAADVEGSVYDRRSITIDNTPPVCIIENLTSLGTENNADRLSTFGQKVNLSGKIKDDTGVSKVFFDVYDENKNLVGSSSMDYDFSPDGLLLAQYKASKPENEKEKILAQNYNMLYGLKENQKLPAKIDPTKDIKTRYMTFRLSDNARVYNEPVFTNSESSDGNSIEGTGEGNITTEIYLNTQAFGLENITIDELNEYRKHLVVDEEMDAKIARIASNSVASVMLGSNGDFSKITKMQINPEIDPKWYVGSYDSNGIDYEAAFIGSTLTVMFAAGYDNVQFKPSNIRIILAKLEKDASGTYKIVASDNELRNQTFDNDNVIVLKNYGGSEELTLNLTQPVSLSSENIKSQSCYRIMVFGKDGPLGNGLDFKEKNNGWYGIKATKNATPPRITFLNENEDSWIGPDTESFPLAFTIGIDGNNLVRNVEDGAGNVTKVEHEPTVTVSYTDSNGNTKEYKNYKWTTTSYKFDPDKKLYTFDWVLKNETDGLNLPMPADEGNYKLIIKVEAQDDSEGYASSTFKLNIDREKPETAFETASPYIFENNKDYLNGTVKIPLTFKDNRGIKAATYSVNWNGTNETGDISIGSNNKITLNTLNSSNSGKVDDKTEITLKVTATDIFGNTSETEKKYTVDQETDRPKLAFGNLKATSDFTTNSFGLTSGNKISASATDDDGNVKVEVKVWGVNDSGVGTEPANYTTLFESVSGLIDFNFYEKEFISKDGKYKLKFKVTDSVGNLPTSVEEFGPYNILVDGSAPIFKDFVETKVDGTEVAKDGNYYYIPNGKPATVTVKLTEGNLATVTVNGNAAILTSDSGSTTDWIVNYTWTPSGATSGEQELTFEATDQSGNTKEKVVSLYYDAATPTLKNVTATPVLDGSKVNGKISLKGSVSDNDKIKSVVVKEDNFSAELYNKAESEFVTSVVDTTSVTANADTKPIKFTVVATDRAGNVTTENYTYTIDQKTDEPKITFDLQINEKYDSFANVEADSNTTGYNVFGLNSNNVLTGSATDDDGIAKITIIAYNEDGTRVKVIDPADQTKTITKTYETTSSSFTCNINDKLGITEAGNYVIKVTAEDTKKETAYASLTKTVYLVVDGVPPKVDNIKVADKTYDKEAFIKGSSKVSFDITEPHLKSVTVNGSTEGVKKTLKTGSTTDYTVTYTFTPADTYKNKYAPFKIVATDKSDISTEVELNIFYDVKAPEINKLDLEKLITTYNDDRTVVLRSDNVNGVITITGNISDNDAVASTVVKIMDGANEVKNVLAPSGKPSNTEFTYIVDTTQLTDKHNYTLSVTTTDRAGNDKTETIDFYVDQETDKPVIFFTNATASGAASENKFGIEGWKINGIVEDDDGPATLEVGSTPITVAQSGAFEYEIPKAKRTSGETSVTFIAKDKNDVSREVKLNYVVDTEVPKFGEIKLYNGTSATSYDSTGTAYYSGMFAKEYHKFEFTVSDDNEVTKVEVYKNGAWSDITETALEVLDDSVTDKTVKTVTYEATESDGDITIKFRLTDKYGHQSSERELVYKVDTESPVLTGITTTVGGKADFAGKWFNNSLLSVDMSGIKDANLSADVKVDVTGDTTLSDSFQMNVANGTPKTGKFDRAITFADGTSTVKYTFSDEAGNINTKDVVVNVDTTAPEVTALSITGTGLSSDTVGVTKESTITANFKASDTTSKLAKAVLGPSANFDDSEKYEEITFGADVTSKAEEKSIDISSLADGTHQVWVRVTDNAGNTSVDYQIGSFIKDTTPPVVTIESHSDNATVNKTITISGKATDANPKDEIVGLEIYAVDGTGNKTGSAITTTGLIKKESKSFDSWEYEVDTEKLTDNKSYIKVTTKDKAGNEGSSEVTLKVNQDSDRPVVTLNQINIDGKTTLPTGKINWDVTDDDGTPEYVKIKVEKTKQDGTWETIVSGLQITPSGTSYVYPSGTDKLADGNYKLSFEIKDKGNTTFTTGDSSDTLGLPKIQTTGVSDITGKSIPFAVDGTPPTIKSVKLYMDTGKTDNRGDHVYETIGTEIKGGFYGGTKKQKGKIVIDATDNVLPTNELKYSLKLNDSYVLDKDTSGEYIIDFSTCAAGGLTMTFEVYDNSGAPATKTATVFVDNLPPNKNEKAVTNMRPVPTAEVTGIVEVTANISDDTIVRSGIDSSTVAYYIPKNGETAPATQTAAAWESFEWIYEAGDDNFEVTEILMKFKLSDLTDTSSGAPLINSAYSDYEDSLNPGIYNIPIWIKLSDIVGNTSYVTGNTIKYNPNADRPRVKVLDPVHNLSVGSGTSKKEYVILGGNIRISGSAEDDEGIEGVYVQYDINGDEKYDLVDYNWLKDKGYDVKIIPGRTVSGRAATVADITTGTSSDVWGVKAKNTMSWQATFKASELTTNLEVGHADNTTNKTLNIRVCAADTDGSNRLVSAWSDVIHVSVNKGIPSYNDMKLVQYKEDTYTNEIQSIDYSDDMYISDGFWRLEGFVGDDGGITKIDVTGSQAVTYESGTHGWFISYSEGTLKGYKIKIPVNKDAFKLKIVAYDNTDKTPMKSTSNFSVYIDKKAPEFDGDDKNRDGENDLVLWLNEYGEDGEEISEDTKVQNSDGWTTIASKVTDPDSGFEKAIFYIKRTKSDGTDPRVYNIMEECGNDRTANRTPLVGFDITKPASEEPSGVFINKDGLPVLKKTDVTRSSTTTIEVTGIGSNKNIRVGGLVLIGGFYRTIESVSTDVVTLTEEVDQKYTDAYFVYGAVVDHSGESEENGTIKGDDGDGMAESITKSGTDYIWDATFDSTHIPDGPVEIHVVVFDKVGNKRHGKVDARISNNSPRLARVKLGTDLNGNGTIEDFETTTFVANSKYTSSTELSTMKRDDFEDVWNLDTQSPEYGGDYWKIKEGLKVTPEFVGGTGDIYYVFTKESGIGNGTHLTTAEQAASPTKLNGSITLSNTDIGTNSDDQVNTYRFSFWDKTEETTEGKDSGWAVLNAKLYQDITDNNRPKPIIHPFFWKAKGKGTSSANPYNSIQWKTESDGTETALGHIELEGDLLEETFKSSNTIGVYDLDPKVSGKIVLRGTVYDETRLTEVKISTDAGSILGTDKYLTATYNTATETWTTTGNVAGQYVFTVKDVHGIKQIGHLVEWTLEVDTEKVTGVAKTDVTFTVQGNDGKGLSPETSSQTSFGTSVYATAVQAASGKYYNNVLDAQAGKEGESSGLVESKTIRLHSPRQFKAADVSGNNIVYEYRFGTTNHYKMDVMPYVTKVTTSLSAKDTNNPSKYDRTSLGHYPVQSVVDTTKAATMTNTDSEEVKLYGFNLHGTIAVTNGTDAGKEKPTETELGYIKFKVSDRNFKTGELNATVNGIKLLNNINNNNAKGDAASDGENYANCYNRMANGDNNNNLDDDIWFDVWEFNDRVAEPNKQTVEGTTMEVNSSNHLIQYAYSDGTYMVMGDAANNSGRRVLWGWDTYQGPSIGFHVDARGNTFGCGHPSDTANNNLIDFFRLVHSRWGYKIDNRDDTSMSVSVEGVGEKNAAGNLLMARQRIWSPSMGSTAASYTKDGTTHNTVNLYMAYYDQLWDELRFRAGLMPTTMPSDKNYVGDKGKMFYDWAKPTNGGENKDFKGAKVIADSTTTVKPGKYVSLAARNETISGVSTDIVCIVWFDAQANMLMYAYQTMANTAVETATAADWSFANQEILFETVGGGQYCQIAFDKNGGVHVAAYAGNGHVYYAYAPSYKGTFAEYRVDATDGVGQNLRLDVALNADGNPIPYIGYYNNTIAKAKYAYLTDDAAKTTNKAGVDESGRYTKNWNISVLPTKSTLYINPEDKINVGVWKDSNGKLTYSTTDGKTPGSDNIGTSTRGQNTRDDAKTYGNGTKNAVLLYQIVDSSGDKVNCLESAQLR